MTVDDCLLPVMRDEIEECVFDHNLVLYKAVVFGYPRFVRWCAVVIRYFALIAVCIIFHLLQICYCMSV